MKKILVIGVTGFVGKHLLSSLECYDISCLLRRKRDLSGVKVLKGDVTNKEDVTFASKGVDVIINLAAPNTQDHEENQAVIVKGTRNIIAAAKENRVGKLIMLSSAAAYRKNLDNYGRAKKEAEKLLLDSELNVSIVKPTMVYGKGGYAFEKIINSVVRVPFFSFVIGDGKYKIQPAYIWDVVEIIKRLVEHDHSGVKVFDVGGPYPILYNDFLDLINKKKKRIHLPISVISSIVGFLGMFWKNIPCNKTTIKRMVEEIDLDLEPVSKELNIRLTEYEEGLSKVCLENEK